MSWKLTAIYDNGGSTRIDDNNAQFYVEDEGYLVPVGQSQYLRDVISATPERVYFSLCNKHGDPMLFNLLRSEDDNSFHLRTESIEKLNNTTACCPPDNMLF